LWRQYIADQDNLNDPTGQNPLQTTPVETNGSPGMYADSIWKRPLQNLGDFATQAGFPVSKKNEDIPSSVKAPAVSFEDIPATTGQDNINATEPGNKVSNVIFPVAEQFITSGAAFTKPSIPGRPGTVSPAEHNINFQSENQPFEQATPLSLPSPDVDDLLEELTDRILRDFRRYYP